MVLTIIFLIAWEGIKTYWWIVLWIARAWVTVAWTIHCWYVKVSCCIGENRPKGEVMTIFVHQNNISSL